MATLPLERIKRIKQSIKDTVSGFVREFESSSDLNDQLEIPTSVQFIILLFYYQTIDSTILTIEEEDNLLSLFNEHKKFNHLDNFEYNLIFQGTKDQFSEKSFKEKVHGHKNILCLIQTEKENIIGGFTSTGWSTTYPKHRITESDDKAFIFSIRSSGECKVAIHDIDQAENALRIQPGFYCMFGSHCTIYCYTASWRDSPCCGEVRNHQRDYKTNETWMRCTFDVVEIEVFQLK